MGKHKRFTSLENATSTGPGESRKTAGHPQLGLYVVAEGLDPTNDTLEVRGEVSHNNEDFTHVNIGISQNDDVLKVSTQDFVESDVNSGVYTAYRQAHNVPVEYLRANIISYQDNDATADIAVTAYLYVTGWTGAGKSYNERTDFAPQQ